MQFGKNVLSKIVMALAVVVPAMAADVAPLYFDGIDDSKQQGFWEDLMKYKMFGAEGIKFGGQQILVPDKSGWFGTAAGDFDMRSGNNKHVIGGPVLVGGNLVMSDGNDSITSGPVRVLGNVVINQEANWRNSENLILGNQCVKGTANQEYIKAHNDDASVFVGSNYENCPTSVPQINTDLRIPKLGPNSAVVYPAINTNNNKDNNNGDRDFPAGHPTIDVPRGAGTYDIVIDYIRFTNTNLLEIRMPNGGRLTRIFLTNGFSGGIPSGNQIVVSYMDKDAEFDEENKRWKTGTATQVKNEDYAGNLLFYTTKNIDWAAMNKGDVIQGTFITTGQITVRQSMTLAGQLLADNIYVDAFFDGSGFRYVPFDPPILSLEPTVGTSYDYPESDIEKVVAISLSEITKVDVFFNYCFDVPETTSEKGLASMADFNSATHLYVCGKDTGSVEILAGTDRPTVKSQIKINVATDAFLEGNEKARIKIFDLSGAVMPGNVRDGFFDLNLIDVNSLPVVEDAHVIAKEDVPYTFDNATELTSTYFSETGVPQKGVVIKSLPESDKGSLTYKGKNLSASQVIPVDSLKDLVFTPAKDLYGDPSSSYAYTSFAFTVVDINNIVGSGSKTVYVSVLPVNDAPELSSNGYTIPEHGVKSEDRIANGNINVDDVDDETGFTYRFDNVFDSENTEDNFKKINEFFTIDPSTGVISVKDGVDLNYETDQEPLHIRVVVKDMGSSTDDPDDADSSKIVVSITITDVNEDPIVVNQEFEIKEGEAGIKVHTVGGDSTSKDDGRLIASDPDLPSKPFGQLTYKIDEKDVPFVIDSKTGLISVQKDAVLDHETQDVYTFHVTVADGGDGKGGDIKSKTVEVTVYVRDVNETPHFVKDNAPNYDQDEKTPKHEVKNGDLVKEWEVIDEDSYDDLKNLTLTLTQVGFDSDKDAGKASVKDIFELTSETRPGKNGDRDSMFVKLVVKDADKLNHELVMKDWNDSVFNVVIKVEDAEFSDTLQRTVTIRDLNETPVVAEGQVFEVPEYDGKNVVTEVLPKGWKNGDPKNVVASDSDRVQVPNGQFTYSIAEKDTPFQISEDGVITVKSGVLLDYEDVPSYSVTVWVKDKGNPADSSFATVTINVKDVNEKPELVKDDESNYPIEEKTVDHLVAKGTLINEWEFIDVDGSDDISNLKLDIEHVNCVKNVCSAVDEAGKVALKDIFSLKTESRKGEDGKNHMFVQLVVENPDKLNHEPVMKDWKDSAFTFVLSVTDADDAKDTLIRKVTVRDVNETPAITDTREFTIAESVGENPATKVLPKLWVAGEPDYVLANDSDRVEVLNGKYEYSIADNPYFAIDPVKGVITVKNGVKIDYEDPALEKVGDDKIYKVTVSVKDKGVGKLESSKEITIYVTNENEGPELTDDGKTWIVDEHVQIHNFGSLIATDVDEGDEDNFSWSIKMVTAGAPADLFKIDSKTGEVSVNGSLNDFETLWNKAIYNEKTHALEFKVAITVEDEAHASSTLPKVISIRDVNETPVIADQKFIVKENTLAGDTVRPEGWKKGSSSNVTASENDEHSLPNGQFEYSIVGETPFVIDPITGVITVKADSTLNHEDPALTGSTYPVTVKVKDKGNPADSATAVISIYIDDDNDKPIIVPDPVCDENKENCHQCDPEKEVCTPVTVCDATIEKCDDVCDASKEKCDPDPECKEGQCGYAVNKDTVYISVKENTGKDYKVLEYYVFDEDEADLKKMTVSFVDVNGSGSKDLFKITETLVDGNKLVLTTATDIDYESVKDTHKILIIANDGLLADTIVRVIKIVDENEAPSAEDFKDSIPENPAKGYVVGTVKASDPDTKNPAYGTLSYKVVEDGVPFEMDGNKIIVKDPSALNYEKDSVFVFHVEVTDGATTPAISEVTIKLKDVGETPEIIEDDPTCDEKNPEDCHKCDAMIADCGKPNDPPADCVEKCGSEDKDGNIVLNVKENSPTGTVVLEYYVKDEDVGDLESMKVSIKNDNKSGFDSLFVYDNKLVKDEIGYKLVVTVKDSAKLDYETVKELHKITITVTDKDDSTASIVRTIKVVDVNEPPFVVANEFHLDEHNNADTVFAKIEWGDDKDTKQPAFRDNKVVLIDGDTDVFEVDSVGNITAKKAFNFETDETTYTLVVKVVDKNDPTLFVVDTMTIKIDNILETPYITTPEFKIDENVKKDSVIAVIESEDKDDPENKEDRKYTLVTPSDFVKVTEDGKVVVKDPSKFDYEKNTSFKIDVKVTDPQGKDSVTTIVVSINDVNEAPAIKDQIIHVSEDATIGSVIDTVEAVDPDKNPKYSTLTYTAVGGDTTVFKVNPKTGAVTLIDSLDYEKKKSYELVVAVNDGEFTEEAKVTILVDNILEKSEVEITKVENTDTTWTYPKEIYTNNPDAVITWTQDGDTLSMDTTYHEGKNVIVITYKDPAKDVAGSDTVIVYFSTAAPEVIVTANGNDVDAKNIYTIVEKTDEKDSSIYVNGPKNDIKIIVRDTVAHMVDSFNVKLELDTVKLDKGALSSVTSVAKDGPVLNLNPAGGVSRTPVNGTEVNVSYTEKIGKQEVTVTYKTDNKGEILLTPVIGADGKVDSIEVITVSYVKTINGKEVTVSYQADAATGEVLMSDASGVLMTTAAAESANSSHVSSSSSSKGDKNSSDSKGDKDKNDKDDGSSTYVSKGGVGSFVVTYEYVDKEGNTALVSYVIDENGELVKNAEGDIGYSVAYTYTNKYGNSATQSVFIVLDQAPPVVKITAPTYGQVVYSNYVNVVWTVDGVEQDTLNVQGLEEGTNAIVRFFRDKAGNEASDTVYVVMKDGKNVDIALEQPVTTITLDKVNEYYAANAPEEGQTFGVSIRNPSTGKEVETLKGGSFDTKKGSGEEPYPGLPGHLGPTMSMDIRLPVINDVGGMATLDDLVSDDGRIALEGVDAGNSEKVTVEEYIEEYCDGSIKKVSDLSKVNLYKSKMDVKIWIYTSLGNFVDYYTFTQNLDDPDYTNEAGLLQMYFEMKPDKNGDVRTESGKLLGTGSYVYKVEAKVRSELKCTLPPVSTGKKMGDVVKNSDNLLKPFGYKRPKSR
ncbi:MAG: cadherin repeat domain-containing protein [Fibrobacter sp.]|nr:cadherin repeat domain-containing protein [Fibrobacter sp.]